MRGLERLLPLLVPLLLRPAGATAAPAPAPSHPPPAPLERLLDHPAERAASWQAWLLLDSEDDDSAAPQGGSAPRRITPKSVFIAPAFTPDQLPACAEGYRADSMGRCVKVLRVDQAAHLDFLLRRLNAQYAPPKQSASAAQGPLRLPLPVAATAAPAAPATTPPTPKATTATTTSEAPPPREDQGGSDDAGTADMIISLFGGQEGSGGGAGGETAAVEPTVLSAGPPADDVDVRDTLPMLVLTHTDSSSAVEDEVEPKPQQDAGEVADTAPIRGESNSLPSVSSTSQAPQVTLIYEKHQHSAGGQMMQDDSFVASSPGEDRTPVSPPRDSESPGSSKKRTGASVSNEWRERPSSSGDTVKTAPVGTRDADTSAVGSAPSSDVKVTDPSETSPNTNPSKKNSVRDPAVTQKQHGSSTFATDDVHAGPVAFNSYNSPEVNHPREWSGVTNRIPHTDSGYVRFPQGHGGNYVRFPVDAFQEQRNSGGSKLWWLQPGPDGWRVRHPDPRYRPALVRFFTRLPPFEAQNSWNSYGRHK